MNTHQQVLYEIATEVMGIIFLVGFEIILYKLAWEVMGMLLLCRFAAKCVQNHKTRHEQFVANISFPKLFINSYSRVLPLKKIKRGHIYFAAGDCCS